MLTREKLIEILQKGGQSVMCDLYVDESAMAFFLDCSTRTLSSWRNDCKGPPARFNGKRWIYDISEIVKWYNALPQFSRNARAADGAERKTAEGNGTP